MRRSARVLSPAIDQYSRASRSLRPLTGSSLPVPRTGAWRGGCRLRGSPRGLDQKGAPTGCAKIHTAIQLTSGEGFFAIKKGGSTRSRLNLTNHHYKEPIHRNPRGKGTPWGETRRFGGPKTSCMELRAATALAWFPSPATLRVLGICLGLSRNCSPHFDRCNKSNAGGGGGRPNSLASQGDFGLPSKARRRGKNGLIPRHLWWEIYFLGLWTFHCRFFAGSL
jgi:hypothetical protein